MKGKFLSIVALVVVAMGLFVWEVVDIKQAASTFESVEVKIAELSPVGEQGGYAIPASGGSVACALTIAPSIVHQEGNVPEMTRSWTGFPTPPEFYIYDNDGTLVHQENTAQNNPATFSLPGGLPNQVGTYTYTGRVFGYFESHATEEPPEQATAECTVTLSVIPGYDVRGRFSVPVGPNGEGEGSLEQGMRLTFDSTIDNVGAEDVVTPFNNRVQIDANYNAANGFTPDVEIQESSMRISRLNAGAAAVVSSAPNGGWPSVPSGTHGVRVCADWDDEVAEVDEANCSGINEFVVSGVVSVTSCTVTPDRVNPGQTATWTANISGGEAPYRYDWDFGGSDVRQVSSSNTTNQQTKQYNTVGQKNVTVRVLDNDGNSSGVYPCETLVVEDEISSTPTNVSLDIRKSGTGSWANSVNITAGEQVELRWSADNATRCVGDSYFSTGSGSPTSGTQTNVSEPGSGSRTYEVTCYNGSGSGAPSASDTAVVNVSGGVTGPPEITANPTTVDYGGTTTITWDLNGHTGCSVSGNNGDTVGGNPKTADGSGTSDNLYGETTYTVECTDDGSSDNVTVRVRPQFEEI